jgi:polygalacturonase
MSIFAFRRLALSSVMLAALSPMGAHAAVLICDPVARGARHDGVTNDAAAIQGAIDACSKAGGGVVPLLTGTYLSGPLSLKDHVTLRVDKDARLLGSADTSLFHWAFLGKPAQAGEALISAIGVRDVAITGQGEIDGNGALAWWPRAVRAHASVRPGPSPYGADYPGVPLANGLPRPWLIEFADVQGGRVEGVLATNSPMWNLVLRTSSHIAVKGLRIRNPANSRNTDGIDIVSSDHVDMSDLDISTGDDNIAIKSGLAGFGLAGSAMPARKVSDITITHSTMRLGHGLSIGSELANGAQRIAVSDVAFDGTLSGLRIKSGRDRGGDIGFITAEHLRMTNVGVPLSISDYYGGEASSSTLAGGEPPRPVTATTPFIHDITVSDVTATGAQAAGVVSGLPEAPIRRLVLRDIRISAAKGLQLSQVGGNLHGVTIQSADPAIHQGPGARMTQD